MWRDAQALVQGWVVAPLGLSCEVRSTRRGPATATAITSFYSNTQTSGGCGVKEHGPLRPFLLSLWKSQESW